MRSIFPRRLAGILGAVVRIAGATAVARRHVEVAVLSERDLAPVVVSEGIRDAQHALSAGRDGAVRIRAHLVAANDVEERKRASRVIHEEVAVRRVIGMEGETQESQLAAGFVMNERLEIEKTGKARAARL
jgi:hypothetical protein